ncbi:MAG: DUF456 domain-containing protein [Verrucomicrobiales bacterium]|nr:DUF456 domain-containing protein [Verrucomicrobiales bacterium]
MEIVAGIFDKVPTEDIFDGIKWAVVITLIVVGFIGTFLPIIPGTTLIFVGALVYYFTMGMESSGLAWQGLVFIGVLFVISLVLDGLSGAIGAKWFGSSKWGVIGALLGGIIGLFFGLPGLIIGPILGVFLFEMLIAKKEAKEASNSTIGTVVGGLAGIAARVILALGMVAWFVGDVFLVN